jgi:hypothetical protein
MFSERRMAQCGLVAATLVLVSTLSILYQGSRNGTSGLRRSGDSALIIDHPSDRNIKLASTGK